MPKVKFTSTPNNLKGQIKINRTGDNAFDVDIMPKKDETLKFNNKLKTSRVRLRQNPKSEGKVIVEKRYLKTEYETLSDLKNRRKDVD